MSSGQGFDAGVRRDVQRHGEGRDPRPKHAPGRPGTRVPVDRNKLDNGEVTAKIQSVLSNKVAKMEGPTPMDVGKWQR